MRFDMSPKSSHVLSNACDQSQAKMHTVAELLLLSGTLRPIKTETTLSLENSLPSSKEKIQGTTNLILELSGEVVKSMNQHSVKNSWQSVCDRLFKLSDTVTSLVEMCYHVTYQTLVSSDCAALPPGLINKYTASYAGLEIKLSCLRLKRARFGELSSEFIMEMCSNISKYISILTDTCRSGTEKAKDLSTRDQFKLGIKSVTCAAGSLIASIKSFKGDNSENHHSRVVIFCEPVLAASFALVCLATEEEFVDKGAQLSEEGQEVMKSVFGPCMNVASGCVQICKALREFSYDTSNSHYISRAQTCLTSIQKSTSHLLLQMQKHFQMDFDAKTVSPLREDEAGENHLLEMFRGSSPQPKGNSMPLPRKNNSDGALHPGTEQGSSPRSSTSSSDFSFNSSLSR